MIPIILILIIAVVITLMVDDPYDFADSVCSALLGAVFGSLVVILYLGIQLSTNKVEPVEQPVVSETLVNIADTSYSNTHGSIRGGMFYIYGSISTDNKQAFNYYVKQADEESLLDVWNDSESGCVDSWRIDEITIND